MELPVLHIWTARFDQCRRGRADARTDRATGLIARDPRHGRDPPADANEMTEAYRYAFCSCSTGPAALICSRQPLPIVDRTKFAPAAGLAKGAYVLADAPDGEAGRHPDRQRQRSVRCASRRARSWSRKASRRESSACRHGSCSKNRMRLSRQCAAAFGDGAGDRRRGLATGLAALRGTDRRRVGHAHLRHVGADRRWWPSISVSPTDTVVAAANRAMGARSPAAV